MTSTRKRGANWSVEKELYLVQLFEKDKKVLKGKFGVGVTHQLRENVWQEITAKLNASYPMEIHWAKEDIIKRKKRPHSNR